MTRIPVHSVDSAPEGSRDALKALVEQLDREGVAYDTVDLEREPRWP